MQILEAALATALVLLSFATIVTIIMEIVLKVLRIKAKGFEEIAKVMFNDVLLPRFKKHLKSMKGLKGTKLEDKVKEEKERIFKDFKEFVSTKKISPLDPEKKKGLLGFLAAKLLMKRRTSPDNVGVEDFFEKLAESEIGRALYEKAKDNLDSTIADLAKKYERLGSEVREDFIRNSAFMTQFFGILLAFALNLNVFTFFTTFMTDDELREEIISQSEKILGDAEESIEALQAEKTTTGDENGDLEKISEKLDEIQQDLKGEFYQSLPMGYGDFPYCISDPCEEPKMLIWDIYFSGSNSEAEKTETPEVNPAVDEPETPTVNPAVDEPETPEVNPAVDEPETPTVNPAVDEPETPEADSLPIPSKGETTGALITWALSVFLTGILIGLGGPFWYNFVVKLTSVVQSVRGKAPAPKPAPGGVQPAAAQPATSPLADQFSTAIDAFKLASENLPPPK